MLKTQSKKATAASNAKAAQVMRRAIWLFASNRPSRHDLRDAMNSVISVAVKDCFPVAQLELKKVSLTINDKLSAKAEPHTTYAVYTAMMEAYDDIVNGRVKSKWEK